LTDNYEKVFRNEDLYQKFINFVESKQKSGDIQLEAIYKSNIDSLKESLKQSGYTGSENELDTLRSSILRDVRHDFQKYKPDIQEDIAQNILARHLPERLLVQRSIRKDIQVEKAVDLIKNKEKLFDQLLARDRSTKSNGIRALARKTGSISTVSNNDRESNTDGEVLFHVNF